MKEEFKDIPLVKNEANKRFELHVNGHLAFINFGEIGKQIALVHTEAEPELEGTGAAGALVEKTLHWVEDNKYSLLPFCPYVFTFIKRHPEWKRIVDKRFNQYDSL